MTARTVAGRRLSTIQKHLSKSSPSCSLAGQTSARVPGNFYHSRPDDRGRLHTSSSRLSESSSSLSQDVNKMDGTIPINAAPAKKTDPQASASFYKYFLPFQTTWKDNDQYGHLNNAVYIKYFDGLINEYLVRVCGLEPTSSNTPIGLVIASNFSYAASLEFPSPLLAGLSVTKVGKSSVQYAVSLFKARVVNRTSALSPSNASTPLKETFEFSFALASDTAACYGSMTHVFVDPKTRRPVEMDKGMRESLQALLVEL